MTINEINKIIFSALTFLNKHQILSALELIHKLVKEANKWELNEKYEHITMSYELLLTYASQGVKDEKRSSVLNDILRQSFSLVDECAECLSLPLSSDLYYVRKNSLASVSLQELINNYSVLNKKQRLLSSAEMAESNSSAIKSLKTQIEAAEVDLFNKVWTTNPLAGNDLETLKGFFHDESVATHVKCLISSALMLALIKFYDERKTLLLLELYQSSDDATLQLRALTGAVLAMFVHDNRIRLSGKIGMVLQGLAEMPQFTSDVRTIFIRLIKARNTKNISKQVENDFLSSLTNSRSDFLQKFRGATPGSLSDIEENPMWQQWLEDSGLAKKMEELNELQLEGGDVFIATFSHFKSFPFFHTLANWFRSFTASHSAILAMGDNASTIANAIASAPYMCDSDKYSACLSMEHLPEKERGNLSSQLSEQNNAINEEFEDDVMSVEKQRDSIINRHIQDLYRFFNLFSRRGEFYPLFSTRFNLLTVPFLADIVNDGKTLELVAEFYFKHKFHDDAIYFYQKLLETKPDNAAHIFQKIAYAYQCKGKLNDALTFYKRYELAFDNDIWNMRQIANCYQALKQYDMAIQYLRKAEEIEPENIKVALNIGHCLLETNKTEDALKQYFKVDFLNDSKHRAWRPIAWCAFLLDNLSLSQNYYQKIIEQGTPSAQDYLNYGHSLLASGNTKDATENYLRSLEMMEKNKDEFVSAFSKDFPTMNKKGISNDELMLVIDAVFLKVKGQTT